MVAKTNAQTYLNYLKNPNSTDFQAFSEDLLPLLCLFLQIAFSVAGFLLQIKELFYFAFITAFYHIGASTNKLYSLFALIPIALYILFMWRINY